MSSTVLTDEEVVQKVKAITTLRAADPYNVDCPITPYGMDKRLPEVSYFFECLLQHPTVVAFFFAL